MASPSVVLVGPPGAPLTEIAEELASRLGLAVRSSDTGVAELAGRPAEDVMLYDGEVAYREWEHEAIVRLVSLDGVLVLGGGAVLDPRTEQALAGLPVVFVDTTISEAARYLRLNLQSPTTVINPRAQWLRMFAERRGRYEALATTTVLADGRPAAELADEIVTELSGSPAAPAPAPGRAGGRRRPPAPR